MSYPWRNGAISGPSGSAGGFNTNVFPNATNAAFYSTYQAPYDAGSAQANFQGAIPGDPGFNGAIAGPPGGGFGGGGGGFGPGAFPGFPGAGVPGGSQVFPLPNGAGAYLVSQAGDGSLQVTRIGPVWTSRVGQDGWAHRHYYGYGWWPFSGIWPFN